jgi:hypothetical protein
MATRKKMHQTTVRFGSDLWDALDVECEQLGVSVAQYVREAALARLMYSAGARGDDRFESAIATAQAQAADSAALEAQGRQARRHSRELRDASARRRAERSG